MAKTGKKLFTEFPAVTTREWEEKIKDDLKGKEYEKVLMWRTNEGFTVSPYYRAENLAGEAYFKIPPGEFPYVRGICPENHWLIRQEILVDEVDAANKKAMDFLSKGVNSLGFIFKKKEDPELRELEVLMEGIHPEAVEINFKVPGNNSHLAELFTCLIDKGPWDNNKVKASVDDDPLSDLLLKGKFEEWCGKPVFAGLKMKAEACSVVPGFRTIAVNGKIFGNSGSSVVQELAFSLAMGAEYIGRLGEAGMNVDEAAAKVKFNLSTGSNFFMEIAKLRAGRLLWAEIVKAFGAERVESGRMIVHAETSGFNKSLYDPYINLLRTQTEAMASALGGAFSITVQPFDYLNSKSPGFSERIARNQQILLREESYMDKIADAPGGSYYIEQLTRLIAGESWRLFLEVEDLGGFEAAVRKGFIQKQVKEMAGRRDQNIATGRENLIGVNHFPDPAGTIGNLPDASVFSPVDLTADDAEVETLKPYRGAGLLESLRYRTDQWSVSHKRPAAFMLTIGDPVMRKARAGFSCNFFAAAGFEVIDNHGFESLDEGLAAARNAGSEIVVICSSDAEYPLLVPELAEKTREEILVVAGNPPCRRDLEAIGVTHFIHIKTNMPEELRKYQELCFHS